MYVVVFFEFTKDDEVGYVKFRIHLKITVVLYNTRVEGRRR